MPTIPAPAGAGAPVPTITIGDDQVTLRSFKAFKGAHVAAILAGVTDEAKAVAQRRRDFERAYKAENRTRVPESVVQIREWSIAENAWRLDDQTGERYIELPEPPPDELVFLEVFREAWAIAQTHVLRLLALVLVDDSELAAAEDESPEHVEALLDAGAKGLMRSAELWEIIDLADAARQMLARELEQRAEKAGKLRNLWTTRSSSPPPPAADQSQETQTSSHPTSETQEGSSTGSPTSSEPPTAGTDTTSPTGSPTETPSTSPAAPSEPAAAR